MDKQHEALGFSHTYAYKSVVFHSFELLIYNLSHLTVLKLGR